MPLLTRRVLSLLTMGPLVFEPSANDPNALGIYLPQLIPKAFFFMIRLFNPEHKCFNHSNIPCKYGMKREFKAGSRQVIRIDGSFS